MPEVNLKISEVKSIASKIYENVGVDLRNYTFYSLKNRIEGFLSQNKFSTIYELTSRINSSEDFTKQFIDNILVPETEMFRDPEMWNALKKQVLSKLKRKSNIDILIPESTSGDELHTLLFFLSEEELLNNCSIHTTILTESLEEKIRKGVFTIKKSTQITKNLDACEGEYKFEEILTSNQSQMNIINNFTDYVNFQVSSLLNYETVKKFDLILFRNKMIYYDLTLQEKAIEKLFDLAKKGGYIIIGIGENIGKHHKKKYKVFNKSENIYRKVIL